MPYVPSKKTDGKSNDREIIDAAVEELARQVASQIKANFDLRPKYKNAFWTVSFNLQAILNQNSLPVSKPEEKLAKAIFETGAKYGYEGAYLGEFNYAITRFIQRVPQIKVQRGGWKEKDELRYWVYAETVSALIKASREAEKLDIGLDGVFEDIKDEYKRRVNTAYEAAQILKSGDCYDTPYYTKLAEVIDENGNHVGYQEIMVKRDDATVNKDLLDGAVVLKKV